MNYCEDYPCCGHERGCCPDYDESGVQQNMVCLCGAVLPVNNPASICDACYYEWASDQDDDPRDLGPFWDDEDEEDWE